MSVSGLAPIDRRGHQRRLIIDMLRHVRKAARTEIAIATGLSPQVITSRIDELMREGLVCEIGRRPSARGQPPVDLALNPEGGFAIGVQVEARRLTGIICDLSANVRGKTALACRTDDPDTTLNSVKKVVSDLVIRSRIDIRRLWGVGIVLPGPFGSVEEIERDPLAMPAWSKAPFREPFSRSLSVPVFVGNDATAAAIGEHLHGVARGLKTFFYLYLSEGIGGGLFVEGQPVAGAFGNAGEVGRMHVGFSRDANNPRRLEQIASVDAMRHMLRAAGRIDAADLDCVALFSADNTVFQEWLSAAAHALRVAIANIENLVDPEVLIIGGPVPKACLNEILTRMEPLLPSVSHRKDRPLKRIIIGSAGPLSPALGGATLPLFSGLTTKPHAAKSAPSSRSCSMMGGFAGSEETMRDTPLGRARR